MSRAIKREQVHFAEILPPQRRNAGKAVQDIPETKRKRDSFEASLCPNATCRLAEENHYKNSCERTEKDTRSILLEEYRRNKKARLKDEK